MSLKSLLHLSPEEVTKTLANLKSGEEFPTCFFAKMTPSSINKPLKFCLHM